MVCLRNTSVDTLHKGDTEDDDDYDDDNNNNNNWQYFDFQFLEPSIGGKGEGAISGRHSQLGRRHVC
jgi:hypothetical protein